MTTYCRLIFTYTLELAFADACKYLESFLNSSLTTMVSRYNMTVPLYDLDDPVSHPHVSKPSGLCPPSVIVLLVFLVCNTRIDRMRFNLY